MSSDHEEARRDAEANVENAFNEIKEILKKHQCSIECLDYEIEIYSDVGIEDGLIVRQNKYYETNDFCED